MKVGEVGKRREVGGQSPDPLLPHRGIDRTLIFAGVNHPACNAMEDLDEISRGPPSRPDVSHEKSGVPGRFVDLFVICPTHRFQMSLQARFTLRRQVIYDQDFEIGFLSRSHGRIRRNRHPEPPPP